jgi:hypothetical protein
VTPAHKTDADDPNRDRVARGVQRRPWRPTISCIRTYPMTASR